MVKNNSADDNFWNSLYIALFILLVSIIIGHISTSFKEKFTQDNEMVPTVGNIIYGGN